MGRSDDANAAAPAWLGVDDAWALVTRVLTMSPVMMPSDSSVEMKVRRSGMAWSD